ncbi:MAG: hypothetical protein AB7N76_07515 [Planctomycetota bacterium]
MISRRSRRGAAALLASLAGGLLLAGCASEEKKPEQTPQAELTPDTRNPEAPPFGQPRPKIRPGDVSDKEK